MKCLGALLCLVLIASMLLVACDKGKEETPAESKVYYTVTFQSNGGAPIESQIVEKGGTVSEPSFPVREGYVFNGWLKNNAAWNFFAPVNEDMTLTASWVSVESVFAYERIKETDTAVITALKGETRRIQIPDTIGGYRVVAIGKEVFANLKAETVEEIVIPDTVTSIGEGAFRNTKDITIIVGDKIALTEIGEQAFYGCTGLTEIGFGEGLEKISFEAFSGCTALGSIRFPESLTVIEENAFEGCSGMVTVMMHHGLTSIEDGAFRECGGIKTIFFYGTAEQIESILDEKTADMNDPLQEATVYLYSASEPSDESNYEYWYLDDHNRTKVW